MLIETLMDSLPEIYNQFERDLILRAYRLAMQERYRFYSFGDAMLIV